MIYLLCIETGFDQWCHQAVKLLSILFMKRETSERLVNGYRQTTKVSREYYLDGLSIDDIDLR